MLISQALTLHTIQNWDICEILGRKVYRGLLLEQLYELSVQVIREQGRAVADIGGDKAMWI